MDGTDQAIEGAVDVLGIVIGTLAGALIGAIAAFIAIVLAGLVGRRNRVVSQVLRRTRRPIFALGCVWGALLGFEYGATGVNRATAAWVVPAQHVFLIVGIIALTWLGMAAVQALEDVTTRHYADVSGGRARRVTTQAQVLRRVGQAIVVIIGLVAIILTFPAARVAMGSILASAGLLSLVVGMAAQSSLANMFAGLQVAFTDAIRVGDIVVVDALQGQNTPIQGTVEEITLTYVVLRIWDDRRIIVPSSAFADTAFENWTRRASHLMGTVELRVDWRIPVAALRQEANRLVRTSPLWDGRVVNVQVTDATIDSALIRVVVSAENNGRLWDLRCYIREQLVDWVVRETPYAMPRTRIELNRIEEIAYDRSEHDIARLAQELLEIQEGMPSPGLAARFPEERNPAVHAGEGLLVSEDEAEAAQVEPPAAQATERKSKAEPKKASVSSAGTTATGDKANTEAGDPAATSAVSAQVASDRAPSALPEDENVSSAKETGPGSGETKPADAVHAARIAAARTRAAAARSRRSIIDRPTAAQAAAQPPASNAPNAPTEAMSTTELADMLANPADTYDGFFTGSPEAEERAQVFYGPGADALEEREQTARQRAVREGDDRPRQDDLEKTATATPAVPAAETAPSTDQEKTSASPQKPANPAAKDVHDNGQEPALP